MRKKYLFIILLAILVTSCSLSESSQDGTKSVTLTLMGKKSDLDKSYMKSIFQQYEEKTGNKLDIISIEDAEFETEAAERFDKGNVPDIFMHFHNADLDRFDVDSNFYYLNDEKWTADLTDGAKAYCTDSSGRLLGLPFWENSVSGCYYNKTILNDLGLKPATTQTEFDVLCQALADTGYTPICWPANGCSWMIQFGMDPIFADNPELLEKLNKNEITYSDIPEMTNMVQWIANAAEKGWFGNNYPEYGWDEISPVMGQGQAVMTFIWDTWFYTDYSKENKYTIDDFALMPVFMNTAEKGTYEGGNLNMMMANKNSKNIDAVLDFLSFCASEENYNVAFDGISTVNCFKNQTTNIQSDMVTSSERSIKENERVSTASSRIIGYSADEVAEAINSLLHGKVNAEGCVKLMDEYRIAAAAKQGAEGF